MSRVTVYQNAFTVGEIDPLLQARVDLQQYEAALDRAKNVVVMPQGGLERRPGLRFMKDLTSHKGSSFTDIEAFRLVSFEFSTSQSYMLVFVKNTTSITRMFVYANLQLQTDINGSGNDYLECSLGDIDLSTIYFTQSADTLILVQEDMAPKKIVRGTSNSNWTISDLDLTTPYFNINPSESTNVPGNITPSAVDNTINITFSSNFMNPEITGTASAGTTNTITLAGAQNENRFFVGAQLEITGGTGAGQKRFITEYTTSRVATVDRDFTTIPDNTSTYKVFEKTQQYIVSENGFGRARLIERNSNTVAKALVIVPFFNTDAVSNWKIESGYEAVFSDERGYPRTCTFHEGRLFFGGTKSLPSTLIGSKVNDFFNFQSDEGLADDAIFVTLSSDSVNSITGIRSGRDLQIFSTSSEFFIPQAELDPITPSNIVVKTATKRGSRDGIRPVAAEGGTLFIQREGKAIREFLFSDVDLSYAANNISLLSSHLLKDPKHMALRLATSTDDGDLLLITNGDDGTMMAVSILRSQNVIAPTEFVTAGSFLDVSVDITDIYTIVRRDEISRATAIIEGISTPSVGQQLQFSKNDGTLITVEVEAGSGVGSGSAASGNTHFVRRGSSSQDFMQNLNITINSISGFSSVYQINDNTVTVTRLGFGINNLSITSNLVGVVANNFVGNIKYYLESFDDDRTTDANIQYFSGSAAPDQNLPGSTTASNLGHLEGATVKMIRDDIVLSDATVSSGNVTIDQAPTVYLEVGLDFDVDVRTLPPEPRLPSGIIQSRKKRIVEVTPILDRTQNLTVNGFNAPIQDFPITLGSALPLFTGRARASGFLGYNDEAQITVSQSDPVFFTLLALEYKLSYGG